MLRNIIIRLLINAAALWFVDVLFEGIQFDNIQALVITSIVFGILNTFIKPILVVLTLPINILTLGFFTLIINAFILRLTDYWVDSFHTSGFGVALIAAVFISIISVLLQNIFREE